MKMIGIFKVLIWEPFAGQLSGKKKKTARRGSARRDCAAEQRRQGVGEGVPMGTRSDLGRPLTDNGHGTDHAWGGVHMLLGGGVAGGKVVGKFPRSLAVDGTNPLDVGRGRQVARVAHPN